MGQFVCAGCTERSAGKDEVELLTENPTSSSLIRSFSASSSGTFGFNLVTVSNTVDSCVCRYLTLLEDSASFSSLVQGPDCTVESLEAAEGPVLKYQFRVPFEPEVFLDFLGQVHLRTQWDDNVASSEMILEEDDIRITKTVYKKVLGTAARESLLASKRIKIRKNYLDLNMSVDSDKFPVQDGNVRVHVKLGGYFVESIPRDSEGNICLVTAISCADFGFSPALAQLTRKLAATAIPRMTRNLQKALKQVAN